MPNNNQITRISRQLKSVFAESMLEQLGRETGFEKRTARVITTFGFLTSLLSSLSTRTVESLADLVRDFNYDHDCTVNYKPYYKRLDQPEFPKLMRQLFDSLTENLCLRVLKPNRESSLSRFKDVVIQDGTSFQLHSDLSDSFPGRFTTISPAAVEVHTTMSLFSDNLICVASAPDSECERHFAPDPASLRDKLFLGDRGYDGTPYMAAIDSCGGSFIIRIRSTLDPKVTKIHRRGRKYRALEGKRLSAVLKKLPKRAAHDLDVQWEDKQGQPKYAFRLVAKWSRTEKSWFRLMTNIERENFLPKEVSQAYRLRWQVELYYKELKSYANLHAFSTSKKHIAEGLIWASLCAAFLKRYFAHACQRATHNAISTRRVAMCSHTFLAELFRCLQRRARTMEQVLAKIFEYLSSNARRSNPKRDRKKGRLATGLDLVGFPQNWPENTVA